MKKIKTSGQGKVQAKEVFKYLFFTLYVVFLAGLLYVSSPVLSQNSQLEAPGENQ